MSTKTVRDGRGHEETIATVQLDFNQPQRFSLSYDTADGSRQPVVMIHRGTVGAMERVVATLLERYQAAYRCGWLRCRSA